MHTVCFQNAFLRSPVALFKDNQSERERILLKSVFGRCPNASIIGLCEVWSGFEQSVAATARIQHGFSAITDDNCSYIQNSGLCMLYDTKKHDLVRSAIIRFKHSYLLDTLASKGFMVCSFRDKHTHRYFNVVLTHLNDGYAGEYSARTVQLHQLTQLKWYVRSYLSPKTPCIIMGDFNIDIRTNEYRKVSSQLMSLGANPLILANTYHAGLCICSRKSHQKQKKRRQRTYDYIFTTSMEINQYMVHDQAYRGLAVSDHSMVSITFSL